MLTDRAIKLAKTDGKDLFLIDNKGLYLRVRQSGTKVWAYRYRVLGRTRWLTIGDYPAISLAEARDHAAMLKKQRRQGIDPRVENARLEAEETQRRENEKAARAADAARLTVGQLFDRWERLELAGRKDAGAEVRRSFNKDVLPVLRDVPVADVTRPLVANILDRVVERGARIVARNLLGDIRQMYGFAIGRGMVEHDPTSHMKRDDFGKKVERDRVLSDDEIRELAIKLPAARMQDATALAIWILLGTCCRVGELSRTRWDHLDLDAGTWRIPPENAKNAKEHTIYLSKFATAQFAALKAINGRSEWCYPAENDPARSVYLKSISKQVRDRQRTESMKGRSKATGALILSRGNWTPHDLRRTGATMMGALGVRPDVIEKCLNHVVQNRMIRTYQRQTLEAEQREAWRLLGKRMALLLKHEANNIVTAKFSKDA